MLKSDESINDLTDLIKVCNGLTKYSKYERMLKARVHEMAILAAIKRDLNKDDTEANAILEEIKKKNVTQTPQEDPKSSEDIKRLSMPSDILKKIKQGVTLSASSDSDFNLSDTPTSEHAETEKSAERSKLEARRKRIESESESDDENEDDEYGDLFVTSEETPRPRPESSANKSKGINLGSLSDSPQTVMFQQRQQENMERERKADVEKYKNYLEEKYKILEKNPDWDYKTATTEQIEYIKNRREFLENFNDKFYIPKTPITDINDPKYQAALKAEKKHYLNATNKDIEDIENKEWMDGGGARYKVKYN